ncbi:MAG: hypothetical protein CL933_11030 [Deltaproteobacteria bacterium]|nr:hypothetical protein [Deltaproteobacteria bacterium]
MRTPWGADSGRPEVDLVGRPVSDGLGRRIPGAVANALSSLGSSSHFAVDAEVAGGWDRALGLVTSQGAPLHARSSGPAGSSARKVEPIRSDR